MTDTDEPLTDLKHDNKTITLVTTALVAICNLVKDTAVQKILVCCAPCVTLAVAYCFIKGKNYCYHLMERRKTMETYNAILAEQNLKLKSCSNPTKRAKIEAMIEKYENDRNQVRIKQTRKFI